MLFAVADDPTFPNESILKKIRPNIEPKEPNSEDGEHVFQAHKTI